MSPNLDSRHKKGKDKLTPLRPIDLSKVNSFSDLTDAMKLTSFGGREVGEAVDVLFDMAKDKSCLKVLTLSGAMTVAKQGLLICDLIDRGVVDIVISTGALMAHGFIESAGMTHFKYEGCKSDEQLYEEGYDRVYDTLELEANLDEADEILNKVFDSIPKDREYGSFELNWEMGKFLDKRYPGRAILKSALKRKVPVYIPAFTDSEFGLDFATYNMKQELKGKPTLKYDAYRDVYDYANRIFAAKKTGVLTIGGGTPRNWAQQVAPLLDLIRFRFKKDGLELSGGDELFLKPFSYGVRICPEPVNWGGLSGCTYSEGVSWGKFKSPKDGGRLCEVLSDATVVWPLITKSLFEKMDAAGIPKEAKPLEQPKKQLIENLSERLKA